MKFSYSLIKKLLPKVPPQAKLAEGLNLKSFETEINGKNLEISVSPNRFSDAASHWGMAKEAAAIFKLKMPPLKSDIVNLPAGKGILKINVKDAKLCPRYEARYFELKKKVPPAASKKFKGFLEECGLKSINPVVDIMNYVMLETGQPLHAFDADKLEKNGKGQYEIIVRRAKNGEKIKTLDNQSVALGEESLVIADAQKSLAIAGIKGGKEAEITAGTKKIIIEAAAFDGANIFKTSKKIGLQTDASSRFAHNLSPALAGLGADRATILLKELGAELVDSFSFYPKPVGLELIEFDVERFNRLIGVHLDGKSIIGRLESLGFEIKKDKKNQDIFLVKVPALRNDISNFEDLAEEAARLGGYDSLKSVAPMVSLASAKEEDVVMFKEKTRVILTGLGFDEVYNYSFVSKKEGLKEGPEKNLEFLKNPISEQFEVLRPDLKTGLAKNFEENARFFERFQIFEIGKVFGMAADGAGTAERWDLGMALAAKKGNRFLELKGAIDEFFKKIGLIDYFLKELPGGLRIETGNLVLGELGLIAAKKDYSLAWAELRDLEKLMKLTEGEKEFEPFPKYPAIMRDLSFLADKQFRIGNILMDISRYDLYNIENVDLVDEYTDKDMKEDMRSLTFRLVFRSDKKTMLDKEADEQMAGIRKMLEEKYGAIFR